MGKRQGKIEYFEGVNGRWFFHRRASNGAVVDPCGAPGYSSRAHARRAAKTAHPGVELVHAPANRRHRGRTKADQVAA